MTKSSLSDMLSKLSLDAENEDKLSFYLSFLRRKGKHSILFSKKACFVTDLDSGKWIYLELKKIADTLAWGCSFCENLKTFRNMQGFHDVLKHYCIHAQVASMMINEKDLEAKFNEPEEVIEVVSEEPYYAIAHVDIPAVIHFPRQTKTANCSQHPGAHKQKKSRCGHLSAHFDTHFSEQGQKPSAENGRVTRASSRVNEIFAKNDLKMQKKTASKSLKNEERKSNQYKIRICFPPDESMKQKNANIELSQTPYPTNLIPNPDSKYCECGNMYCSKENAIQRYLIRMDTNLIILYRLGRYL